ncbi:hypothetical protein GQ457_03G025180 [Hibiscus cannabinus]
MGVSLIVDFFSWYDAHLTPRARVVIVGLLRKVKKMERAKMIERISWFLFPWIVVWNNPLLLYKSFYCGIVFHISCNTSCHNDLKGTKAHLSLNRAHYVALQIYQFLILVHDPCH